MIMIIDRLQCQENKEWLDLGLYADTTATLFHADSHELRHPTHQVVQRFC